LDGRRFPADNRQLITDYCLSTAKAAKGHRGYGTADERRWTQISSRQPSTDNSLLLVNRRGRQGTQRQCSRRFRRCMQIFSGEPSSFNRKEPAPAKAGDADGRRGNKHKTDQLTQRHLTLHRQCSIMNDQLDAPQSSREEREAMCEAHWRVSMTRQSRILLEGREDT